jgi:hypothetical protein
MLSVAFFMLFLNERIWHLRNNIINVGSKVKDVVEDEPTWRCHHHPFIGALGIQEPVIPGEPLIKR